MNKEPDRSQRKALGKGLSALLPSRNGSPAEAKAPVEADAAPASAPVSSDSTPLPGKFENFKNLPLFQIEPDSDQPRVRFDPEGIKELSQSIRAHGIIQPITVRRVAKDQYSIVAGERRWRAALLAGLTEIPAVIRQTPDDQRLELALIENIQREDLNPIEIATAFQRLQAEYHLSHEQIAQRTGKDRSTVTNFLRLLKLAPYVQAALVRGEISMGHARALLNLDPAQQTSLCEQIRAGQLSVREVEGRVKQLTDPPVDPQSVEKKEESAPADPNVRAALDEMAMALGTKVRLVARSQKSGRLEIEYYSQEDLDRIYSVIVK